MDHHRQEEARLTSFINLWKDVYGEELSRSEALERLAQLLNIYRTLASPNADASDAPSVEEDSQ